MILNFDRGYGQSTEQMIQSLMESTQMALDTMERKLSEAGLNISGDGGNTSLLDAVYPVGSIYISVSETSPEQIFGGKWEQIKDQFILAAGDKYEAGNTGGSSDAKIPEHSHKAPNTYFLTADLNQPISINTTSRVFPAEGSTRHFLYVDGSYSGSVSRHGSTAVSGESASEANMPPYLSVYMWKRTE